MILLRSCRREPTGIARCIAVSSIAMFVYRELCYKNQHPRIPEAVTVLLLALKVSLSNSLWVNGFKSKIIPVLIFFDM